MNVTSCNVTNVTSYRNIYNEKIRNTYITGIADFYVYSGLTTPAVYLTHTAVFVLTNANA